MKGEDAGAISKDCLMIDWTLTDNNFDDWLMSNTHCLKLIKREHLTIFSYDNLQINH